jgi:hypothetical protein
MVESCQRYPQTAIEVEGASLGTDRFSIGENEARIRVALGLGCWNKLPFLAYLAILFKVHGMSLLRLRSAPFDLPA